MIDELVDQIEGRFGELERQMSDPRVIADRERYAEVGREYRELQAVLAVENPDQASEEERVGMEVVA